MALVVPQIIQKSNTIPQIHPSNLAQNTHTKNNKFTIPVDEDSDDKSESCESDTNAELTESIFDNHVEDNDISQNTIQSSQKEIFNDDVEMEKADETTDATGHVNKDCDDRIDEEHTIIDQGKDLSVQDCVEMNDPTQMEGGSVIIGEQNIVQDGLTDFNNHED
jgi:hypothetical protein